MHQGKMTGYFAQGFNPLNSFPNKAKVSAALSKLKFLVIMDPLATETSSSGRTTASSTTWIRAKIPTEVSACRPPVRRNGGHPTPAAGCNGAGRAPTVRAMPRTDPRSWPGCS